MFPMHLLTVVLATLSLAYCDDHYPIFPACNQDTLRLIKIYHTTYGTPEGVLEKASKKGTYMVLRTSYDHNDKDTSCIYVNFSPTACNVTFVTNGVIDYVLRYNCEEEYGIIKAGRVDNDAPEYRLNLYPIVYQEDEFVFYLCSNLDGYPNVQPTANILLTKEGANKATTNPFLNSMGNLLTQWGFNLNRNYSPECLITSNVPNEQSPPNKNIPSISGIPSII